VAAKSSGGGVFDNWKPGWAVVSVLGGVAIYAFLRRRYADDTVR